jgi:hypothetical protein
LKTNLLHRKTPVEMIRYLHYSGVLLHAGLIDELVEETKDICRSHGWPGRLIDISGFTRIRGLEFTPEGCQPIYLTFLLDGHLSSPVRFMYPDIFGEEENLFHGKRWIYVQTQDATQEIHLAVVQLFEYLKQKYFHRFDIRDEIRYGIDEVTNFRQAQDDLLSGVLGFNAFEDHDTRSSFYTSGLPDKIRKLLSRKRRKRK